MYRSHALPIIIAACFATACGTGPVTTSANTNTVVKAPGKPTNANTVDEAKKTQEDEKTAEDNKARNKAVDDFVLQHYKGWTIQGFEYTFGIDCKMYAGPCDLHLTNGKQTKVIAIVIKEFAHPDGSVYWLAFEARSVDLSQNRINEIKGTQEDETREQVLANLDYDDCQSVIDAMADEYDGRDFPDQDEDMDLP
jgi:hypothetical protein